MNYYLLLVALAAVVSAAGCVGENQNSVATPTPKIVYVTVLVTPSPPIETQNTPVPTPTPIPVSELKITDGFWCRDKTLNIGKDPTEVRECYQFFSDGTYIWGHNPGKLMGKSASCSGDPSEKCYYSLGPTGRYEIEGGYAFLLSGTTIVDPHDPPHFTWSATGIP